MTIQKATISDIVHIHALLKIYGDRGEMLARPLSELYDHVRDFHVSRVEGYGGIVGCCALQFCWEDMAEIRSLAVRPEFKGKGIGPELVNRALEEAAAYHIPQVFTLTYQPDFFKRFGFATIDRNDLPIKIWKDCMICVKFPDCDETAMLKQME